MVVRGQAVTSEDAAVLKALESADYRRKEELAAQRANKQHKEIEELKRKLANTQVHVNDDQVYSSASRSDESDCQAGAAEAGGSHEAVLKQVEIENTSRLKEEAKQRENEAAEQIRRLQEQLAAAMQKAELGAAEG